jgi:16S rRNA (cytosine1402-N4)-methyltransferase
MGFRHIPVMVDEVVSYLNCGPGKIFADCTLGGAGHARAILERILPGGLLIGIDQDRDAIDHAVRALQGYASNICLFHDHFINLPSILSRIGIGAIDGALADLGLSLYQIESSGRGFSFSREEPLDMRMNMDSKTTAKHIVNSETESRLEQIFRDYGEERWARKIARAIASARSTKNIRTSRELADIVCKAIPKRVASSQKIHPATRVFMALRIAVNRELDTLDEFIVNAVDALKPGGRLCVLSFHSLEDRIVKRRFKALETGCVCPTDFPKCVCGKHQQVRVLTRRVVRPTPQEIGVNPMSRSTRLRALEKIGGNRGGSGE